MRAPPVICLAFVAIFSMASRSQGQKVDEIVVATVDGQNITLSEVHFFLDRTLRNLPKHGDRSSRSKEIIELGINHCIKREVILQYLQQGKYATSEREIDFEIEELVDKLGQTNRKLSDHLQELKLDELEFRKQLRWLTSWKKYARKHVTTEHLKAQFDKNPKRYDGGKIRVAQILWKSGSHETIETARSVRKQIVAGDVDWDAAVVKHSQAASVKDNGDLGWIEYAGPMLPKFNEVAFALDKGELSSPFVTQFGTHIVKCIDVKPGDRSFEDAAEEIRNIETNRLFELVFEKQSKEKQIVRNPDFSAQKSDSSLRKQ